MRPSTTALHVLLLAACFSLLPVTPAGAQAYPGPYDPRPLPTRDDLLWFELGIFSRDFGAGDAVTSFPLLFGADLRVLPRLHFRARFGLAGLATETAGIDDTVVRPGNPAFGLYFTDDVIGRASRIRLGVGGMLTLPIAQLPDSGFDRELYLDAYGYAYAQHGAYNLFLWLPETWGLVPGAYVDIELKRGFVGGSADLAFLFGTDGNDGMNVAQFRLEGGFLVGRSARIGLAYTGVVLMDDDSSFDGTGDDFQGALRPFVRGDVGPVHLGAELVMNLDEPYGWAFDDGIWGLQFRIGARL